MIENHPIQTRGFHNLTDESGNVVGFQFCMHPRYYRGLWLSQFLAGDIVVDDVRYPQTDVVWEIHGVEYTLQDMHRAGHVWWQLADVATVKVSKPGGLGQGYHDIVIRFGFVTNYIAPEREDPELGVNFKGYEHKKQLLLV